MKSKLSIFILLSCFFCQEQVAATDFSDEESSSEKESRKRAGSILEGRSPKLLKIEAEEQKDPIPFQEYKQCVETFRKKVSAHRDINGLYMMCLGRITEKLDRSLSEEEQNEYIALLQDIEGALKDSSGNHDKCLSGTIGGGCFLRLFIENSLRHRNILLFTQAILSDCQNFESFLDSDLSKDDLIIVSDVLVNRHNASPQDYFTYDVESNPSMESLLLNKIAQDPSIPVEHFAKLFSLQDKKAKADIAFRSPFHYAAEAGNLDVIRYFFDNNCQEFYSEEVHNGLGGGCLRKDFVNSIAAESIFCQNEDKAIEIIKEFKKRGFALSEDEEVNSDISPEEWEEEPWVRKFYPLVTQRYYSEWRHDNPGHIFAKKGTTRISRVEIAYFLEKKKILEYFLQNPNIDNRYMNDYMMSLSIFASEHPDIWDACYENLEENYRQELFHCMGDEYLHIAEFHWDGKPLF